MKCVPDKNNPLSFEGPEIYKCKVSKILVNSCVNFKIIGIIIILGLYNSMEQRQECDC